MPKRLLVKVNEADNVAIAVQEIKAGAQVQKTLLQIRISRRRIRSHWKRSRRENRSSAMA